MGLIANQMLMEAIGKIVTAIKEKRADEVARGQEQSEKNESKEDRSSV